MAVAAIRHSSLGGVSNNKHVRIKRSNNLEEEINHESEALLHLYRDIYKDDNVES